MGYNFLIKNKYIIKRVDCKRGILFNNCHIVWFSKTEFDTIMDDFFNTKKTFNFLKLYLDNDFYKTIDFRLYEW
jgi:hypothetical protein